jgi:carbon storage regulator
MLVLTRKTNQSIMIGDEIEVSVLAVSRDKIRLGIAAPRDIPVFRKEVYLSIKEEQVTTDGQATNGQATDGQATDGQATDTVETALDQLSTD